MNTSSKALQGIKVLDCTQFLSGPFATMILGDLGAEIIKIEKPGGDDTRTSPPLVKGESTYFMSVNRGKKSIVLDLKKPEHKQIFLDLAGKVDVLIENGRPGGMEKMGLGYLDIQKVNPGIIYASISGFGQNGPYRERGGLDVIIQAMSGFMSVTGEKGGRPTKAGPSVSDVISGFYAVIGILAALNHRRETGKGQYVDIAMLDSTISVLENALARYLAAGVVPKPVGNRHTGTAPFQPFETSDGEVILCVINNPLFERLCKALGSEELLEDERFKGNAERVANVEALADLITVYTKKKTTAEMEQALEKAGIPYGGVNTIPQVIADPQVQARNMIVEIEHPIAGPFKMAGSPFKLSETPVTLNTPSPILGQHTQEILKTYLGKTDAEIEGFLKS